MLKTVVTKLSIAALGFCAFISTAHAQVFAVPDSNEIISLTGGFGVAYLSANELVYSSGSTLSHLIWEGAAPIVSGSISSRFNQGWHLSVFGSAGLGGDHYITDYDWISPYATGTGPDDWSHRSQHPDTRLDHYVSASLRTGYHVVQTESFRAGLHVEANYTDVQWTGYGGSYIYSVSGLHDSVGNFTDGSAGITYRQYLPMAMAGLDVEADVGPLRLTAMAQGGFTFFSAAEDDHWRRNLNFIDEFDPAPVLAAELRADYATSPDAGFFAAVSAKKVFTIVGDTTTTNTSTGATTFYSGAAGGDFLSATATAGFTGKF